MTQAASESESTVTKAASQWWCGPLALAVALARAAATGTRRLSSSLARRIASAAHLHQGCDLFTLPICVLARALERPEAAGCARTPGPAGRSQLERILGVGVTDSWPFVMPAFSRDLRFLLHPSWPAPDSIMICFDRS